MYQVIVRRGENLDGTQWAQIGFELHRMEFSPVADGIWEKKFDAKPEADECAHGLRNHWQEFVKVGKLRVECFPPEGDCQGEKDV